MWTFTQTKADDQRRTVDHQSKSSIINLSYLYSFYVILVLISSYRGLNLVQLCSAVSGNTGRYLAAKPKARMPAVTSVMVIVSSIHDGMYTGPV